MHWYKLLRSTVNQDGDDKAYHSPAEKAHTKKRYSRATGCRKTKISKAYIKSVHQYKGSLDNHSAIQTLERKNSLTSPHRLDVSNPGIL